MAFLVKKRSICALDCKSTSWRTLKDRCDSGLLEISLLPHLGSMDGKFPSLEPKGIKGSDFTSNVGRNLARSEFSHLKIAIGSKVRILFDLKNPAVQVIF